MKNNRQLQQYEADNIFYTVKFENQFVSDNPDYLDKVATKNNMTSIILEKQINYKCAVHSFELDLDLPLFIFPISQGTNNNPNLSDFYVTFEYLGVDYQDRVVYVPQSNHSVPIAPNQNQGVQDLSSLYYYVYSPDHFVNIINISLSNCHTLLTTAHPATFGNVAPYLIHNSQSGLISLIVPYSYYNLGVHIYFNRLLGIYFYSFDYNFFQPTANQKHYKIILSNRNNENAYALKGTTIPVSPAPPLYLEIKQNYDSRYRWNNIRNILFVSDSIKTRNEYLPQTINENSFNLQNVNNLNPNFQNILSYFSIISESSGTRLPWLEIQYYQPHIYKWIDLVSDENLNRIQISLYFELQTGELIPVRLPPRSNSKITLLFRRI